MDNTVKEMRLQAESNAARQERTISRLCGIIALLIILLVGSNAYWIYNENQYTDIATTIETQQDGSGTNIVGGGDVRYGAESKNNN